MPLTDQERARARRAWERATGRTAGLDAETRRRAKAAWERAGGATSVSTSATPTAATSSPPIRVAGLPAGTPLSVDPRSTPVTPRSNPYGDGVLADLALGLDRGVPVLRQQVGGAMALAGGILPGGIGDSIERAGRSTMSAARADLSATPQPETWAGRLAESVPGFAGTVAAGLATGGGAGVAMGAGLAGAQSAGGVFADRYDAMRAGGASDEEAWRVAAVQAGPVGLVSAVTSVVPFGRYLTRRSPEALRRVMGSVGARLESSRAGRLVLDGLAEGSQEAVEEFSAMLMQAAAEADPEVLTDWRRVGSAFAGGGVLGVGGGAAVDLARARAGGRAVGPDDETARIPRGARDGSTLPRDAERAAGRALDAPSGAVPGVEGGMGRVAPVTATLGEQASDAVPDGPMGGSSQWSESERVRAAEAWRRAGAVGETGAAQVASAVDPPTARRDSGATPTAGARSRATGTPGPEREAETASPKSTPPDRAVVGDTVRLPEYHPLTAGRNYGSGDGIVVKATPKFLTIRQENSPENARMFGPTRDVRIPRTAWKQAQSMDTASSVVSADALPVVDDAVRTPVPPPVQGVNSQATRSLSSVDSPPVFHIGAGTRESDRTQATPSPESPAGTTQSPPAGDSSRAAHWADEIEAKARRRIAEIDRSVAEARRNLRPGQRAGHGAGFDYLIPYAQIAAARAVKAVDSGVGKARRVAAHVADVLAEAGITDPSARRRVNRIARAIFQDAAGEDGTFTRERVYQVIEETTRDAVRRGEARTAAEGERREARTADRLSSAAAREIGRAFKEGRREGRRVATETLSLKIDELAERARRSAFRERIRSRMEASETRRRADYERSHAQHVESLRRELVGTIREVVRPGAQGRLLAKVPEVRTRRQFQAALDDVRREVDRSLERQSTERVREIRRLTGPKNLSRLPQDDRTQTQTTVRTMASAAAEIRRDARLTPRQRLKELNALHDQIRRVYHEHRRAEVVRVAGRIRDARTERANVVNAVTRSDEIRPVSEDRPERRRGWITRQVRKYRHMYNVAKALDGDWSGRGPVSRVFRSFARLADAKWRLRQEFLLEADRIVRDRGYASFSEFMARVSGTLGRAGRDFVDVEIGGRRRITKGEAMGIYAMDQETRSRASAGRRFSWREAPSETFELTDAQRTAIEDALSADDMIAVDALKSLYDSMFFGRLNRVSMELNGHTLRKIHGYWGISVNRNLTEDAHLARGWRGYILRHLENVGYLQEREDGRAPIFVEDFGDALLRRMNSASLVVTHASELRSAEMVLRSPEVMAAIARHHGDDVNDRILHTLGELAETNQPATAADGWNRLLRHVNSNVSAALTQVNPATWGRQMGGVPMLAPEIGWRGVIGGLRGIATVRIRDLTANAPFFWARYTRGVHTVHQMATGVEEVGEIGSAQAAKATLRQLAKTGRTVAARRWREFGADLSDSNKAWQQFRETMRWGNWFDSVPARVAWSHFDRRARREHPEWTGERRTRWVAARATDAFRRTQNTNDVLTSSGWAQAGRASPWVASFLSFTSDQHKKINLLEEMWHAPQPGHKPKFMKAVVGAALSSLWSAMVTWGWRLGLFAAGATLAGRGASLREREEAQGDAAWRLVNELASMFPLVGSAAAQLAESSMREGRRGGSPLDSPAMSVVLGGWEALAEVGRAIDDALESADDPEREKAIKAGEKFAAATLRLAEAGATTLGAPTPLLRAGRTIAGKAGETKPEAVAGDVLMQLKRAGLQDDWRYRWMLEERREYRRAETGEDREWRAQQLLDAAGRIRMGLTAESR